MGSRGISPIIVTPLRRIPVVGGDVLHAVKAVDAGFAGFGEAYFSWINPGAVKAWKKHKRMTLNLVVPIGSVRFVFLTEITNPQFQIEDIGESRYSRLTVPPGIWFGFQSISETPSLLLNVADIQHDPDEVEKLGVGEIQYEW